MQPRLKDKTGATTHSHSLGARLSVWRDQHHEQFIGSLQRLLEKPLANSVTLLLLTIAILLPCLLYIGMRNIEHWVNHADSGLEVSAYLHIGTNKQLSQQLANDISLWPTVKSVRYVSAEQAMTDVSQRIGASDILNSLPSNPLPPTLLIALEGLSDVEANAQAIAARLSEQPAVESIGYNTSWFKKAQALVSLGKQLSAGLAFILARGVVLVVANTVRLAIESRNEEILVAKLVGATDSYVRRPFLYMGAWLGGLGASMATIIASASWFALAHYITPLEKAYNTEIPIVGMPLLLLMSVLLGCTLLGWLGAWLICNSHLRRIEPK